MTICSVVLSMPGSKLGAKGNETTCSLRVYVGSGHVVKAPSEA